MLRYSDLKYIIPLVGLGYILLFLIITSLLFNAEIQNNIGAYDYSQNSILPYVFAYSMCLSVVFPFFRL